MTNDDIRRLIEKEFDEKTLGVTEQYLEIHEPNLFRWTTSNRSN